MCGETQIITEECTRVESQHKTRLYMKCLRHLAGFVLLLLSKQTVPTLYDSHLFLVFKTCARLACHHLRQRETVCLLSLCEQIVEGNNLNITNEINLVYFANHRYRIGILQNRKSAKPTNIFEIIQLLSIVRISLLGLFRLSETVVLQRQAQKVELPEDVY